MGRKEEEIKREIIVGSYQHYHKGNCAHTHANIGGWDNWNDLIGRNNLLGIEFEVVLREKLNQQPNPNQNEQR